MSLFSGDEGKPDPDPDPGSSFLETNLGFYLKLV